MQYEYTAKSNAGQTLHGVLIAASPEEASSQLHERELFPVSLKATDLDRAMFRRPHRRAWRTRVSRRDLVTLTSQLAIMTRSGVDLASALENVVGQCNHPTLKTVLEEVHQDVLSGKSVSSALRNHEHVFGQGYVAAMAAAEASGRLPEVLNRLASLLRSEMRMRSTLRTLLAYPILLASISMLVIMALMFFVLPQFAGVFEQLDLELPVITRFLIAISTEVRGRIWLWGPLVLGGVAGLAVFAFSASGHRLRDRCLLNAVLVRDVTRALLIGRAFRLLGTMLESGVPLLEGLRLTRASIRNSIVRELFDVLECEVLNGRGMSHTFLSSPHVPAAAAQMVATAEQTGTLSSVAQLMGEFFEEEGETRLRELATILEPIIIIVMGVIVAFVVMSVMLPVFDFATAGR